MINFGSRLRTLRKAKNLTQKQLASLIGVQNTIISFYEMGDRFPSPEIIINLAKVFNVSTDYLMGVKRDKTINVDGLTDDNIALIYGMINALKDKQTHS